MEFVHSHPTATMHMAELLFPCSAENPAHPKSNQELHTYLLSWKMAPVVLPILSSTDANAEPAVPRSFILILPSSFPLHEV